MTTYCYCCLQRTRSQTGAAAVCVHMHVSVHLPCCVYAGCSLELQCFEIKTEADSSDITEYPHDDTPSTGMFVFIDGQFPCTALFSCFCRLAMHKPSTGMFIHPYSRPYT